MRKVLCVLALALIALVLLLPVPAFAAGEVGSDVGVAPSTPEEAIVLLASPFFVAMAVNVLKEKLGVSGHWLTLSALAVGAFAQVGYFYTVGGGDGRMLAGRVVLGLMLGGAAAGGYVYRTAQKVQVVKNVTDPTRAPAG